MGIHFFINEEYICVKKVKGSKQWFFRDKDMMFLQDYSKQIEMRALEAD